jgi:acetolactate synthase I/II/III large subunit
MVRSHVPVVVIVINIGVLGYQKDAETVKFGRSTTAHQLSAVSHAEIAVTRSVARHQVTWRRL